MEAKEYLETHWIRKKIWTHLGWPKHQRRFQLCAKFLEGSDFIDIGCGIGHSTYHMSQWKEGNWSGMEFWEEAVMQARELFPKFKFYYSENFNFLPICGKHDGVVCSEVIEHVEDDQEQNLINGLIDITKNVLVITTPNIRVNDPGHLRIYTEETLSKLFNGHDHEIIEEDKFFYAIIRK